MASQFQYFVSPSLEEYFVDKETGLPLAAGKIYFWSDVNRTVPKDVFDQDQNPLPNPSTLSAVGTFQDDNGNNILPYYYPYNSDGDIELYFIEVFASDDTPQFSREHWPPNISASSSNSVKGIENFVPNPQFLWRNNVPATVSTLAGQITQQTTSIAPGGWTFDRSSGSTATDLVTFTRYGSYIANPTGNPRYAVTVNCEIPSPADAYKDVRIKFNDVNKFASDDDQYTFSFTGVSNNGDEVDVELVLIKNFGTGGSTETRQSLGTFTLSPTENIFNQTIIFGSNSGKTIGSLNDDYIQLAISMPTNSSLNLTYTDFILAVGDLVIDSFPATTNADMTTRSIFGFLDQINEDADGFDLYLPIVKTINGVIADQGVVGKISAGTYNSAKAGEFYCDGTAYYTPGYTAEGIPNARLQRVLWNNSLNIPQFGTGPDYVLASISNIANQIILHTNKVFSVSSTVDGGAPTGFSFSDIHISSGTTYNLTSYWLSNNKFILKNNQLGFTSPELPNMGTSGFTLSDVERDGTTSSQGISIIQTIAAATLASTYFYFANPTTLFYVWFKVDGVGTDPMIPAATGIEVDLLSTDTDIDVSHKISNSLNNWQVSLIQTVSASSIPVGSWFTFFVNGTSYYIWYAIDGGGIDPKIINKTGIKVDILSGDTSSQVATKTIIKINSLFYAVPDLRGMIIRGLDTTGTVDVNDLRYSLVDGIVGYVIGTNQFDDNLTHTHDFNSGSNFGLVSGGAQYSVNPAAPVLQNVFNVDLTTTATGRLENTVKNMALNYFIKC